MTAIPPYTPGENVQMTLCYRCLTESERQTPAVTLFEGTALCERCARHAAATEQIPPPDLF
jgi:hypothetical protein